MTVYLVVRAVVADFADRARFDTWYRTEHLPDALKAFKAQAAMRGWSTTNPEVHTAYYRFGSIEEARQVSTGPAIKPLIEEFDRVWGDRVSRTRDIVAISDELTR